MFTLIIALITVILVALFSVQNATPVVISFFFWRFEASLAVVIFLSALAGALITVIIYSSRSVKKALAARKTPDDTAPKITGEK
ncbi:MAG: lipopolysaccharide assembly LapA domain-containing protein [Dissulfurispiraceae bacterium]|jgi:uncharacterized integral membrane protein